MKYSILHSSSQSSLHSIAASETYEMSNDKSSAIEHHDFTEPNGNFDRSWREEKWTEGKPLQEEAHETFVDEKDLGVKEALKAYPMAVTWALVMATCVIMEGYDTNLMGNFFAYREQLDFTQRIHTNSTIAAFQIKYGRFVGVTKETPSGYQLTAAWQAGVSQASGIGSFFGTLLNGYLVAKYGQRRVVIGALVAITCFIFLQFFAPNLIVLTVAQVLIGYVPRSLL